MFLNVTWDSIKRSTALTSTPSLKTNYRKQKRRWAAAAAAEG